MGLRAVLASATASAFVALGDIPADIIIRRTEEGEFNPSTGAYDEGATTDYPCQGIVTGYADFLVDGTLIKTGDRKLSIRQAEIAIQPQASDTVIFEGRNWSIINVEADAASVLWKLQMRA